MLNAILIDAGPLIALFDKDDRFHKKIIHFLKNKKYRLITTWAVVTEVAHMLDFNIEAQLSFLEWIMKEGLVIQEISQSRIVRIIELTGKYRDLPMDFADATLVIAAEISGIKKIISIDSDFDVYRLPGKVRIENVFK